MLVLKSLNVDSFYIRRYGDLHRTDVENFPF